MDEEKMKSLARAMVADRRGLCEVLEDTGTSAEGYFDLLEGGEFAAYVARLADIYAKAYEPFVWKALISEVLDGNIQAMKLFFDVRSKRNGGGEGGEDGNSAVLPSADIASLRRDIFT